jgi:hypothetical protein
LPWDCPSTSIGGGTQQLEPGLSFKFQVSGGSTWEFLFGFPNKGLEKKSKMRYKVTYKSMGLCVLVRLPERKAFFWNLNWGGKRQGMDINKMLEELRLEREQIEEAIMTLERLARGRGRRRGRPPAWMSQIKRRGRPPGSKNRPKNEAKASAA